MQSFAESWWAAWGLVCSGDPVWLAVVARSLWVSGCASVLGGALGLALGAVLGASHFPARALVTAALNTSLAIPSVVVGLVVYLLLSRSGPLGFLGWLFSLKAMVLAQSLLVLPVVSALACQVVQSAEQAQGEQLRSMGAGVWIRSLLLAWDARLALLTVLVAGFGRAIAEVGAVMVVGGNIDGFTRVMTTAVALETSKGDLPLALALGGVLLLVVWALQLALLVLRGWRGQSPLVPLTPWGQGL